ncbi:MAG TPA: TonB-dependent receptor [Thermoanaerobaculia bacterium]
MKRFLTTAFILSFVAAAAIAQATATITGTVRTAEGTPVTDAVVTLVEARRSTGVSADGSFRFENVAPGHYHLRAESRRLGAALGEAELDAGANRSVEIVLDPAIHSEEIVVSAGESRRESEVYQPVTVVREDEIARQLQPTIGETLNQEPGVSSTYFGPGASRPIIRGLGSDRIRILSEGLGTADASNVSPDHAVTVDPSTAQQIEILRGPATLLYGSNAVGGVVNVIDERIPNRVPAEAISGRVDLRGGTVSDERTGSLALNGGAGRLAWHLDLTKRDTDDYEIPGPAEHHHEGEEEEEEEHTGVLENSSLESQAGTIGASFVGERGFFGVSFNRFETNYGIPGHAHHDEEETDEEHEEELVRIDMKQNRFDVRGELTDLGIFRNVRLRLGSTDYEHVELEGDEVGTRFTNDGFEGRLEATHRPFGRLQGSLGIQLTDNDFAAVGEEAFVPATTTRSRAAFLFEEIRGERLDFQFGARYEHQDISVREDALPDLSFNGVSASIGTIYRPSEGFAIAASLARATRLPTATELYANGPHVATSQFEIGDVDLDEETSLGLDVSFRKTAGRLRGQINLFNNSFDGFIFDAPRGEEEDGLPVFQYVQADATFRGIEIDGHAEIWHAGANHLELEAGADYVRAELDGGGNLPRIPPLRASLGLRFEGGPLSASAEVRRYFTQDDVAELEEETEGYTLVNATVGYRFFAANTVHDLLLRGTNLTDELARQHTSPLKERTPLPGRDFTLSYRVTF